MSDATQMMGAPCLQELKLELEALLVNAMADQAVEHLAGNVVKHSFEQGRVFAIEHLLAIVEDKLEAARLLKLNQKREPK